MSRAKSHNQQLELRVMADVNSKPNAISSGHARSSHPDLERRKTGNSSVGLEATDRDRLIYEAISDKYFRSEE